MARLPAAPFTLSFRIARSDTGMMGLSYDPETTASIDKIITTETSELQPNGATIWAVEWCKEVLFRVHYYPHDKSARLVVRNNKNKTMKIKLIRAPTTRGRPKGHYMFRSESGLSFVRLIRTEESEFDFDD